MQISVRMRTTTSAICYLCTYRRQYSQYSKRCPPAIIVTYVRQRTSQSVEILFPLQNLTAITFADSQLMQRVTQTYIQSLRATQKVTATTFEYTSGSSGCSSAESLVQCSQL